MTRAQLFDYVREQYGTEPDYPWQDDNAVLRHPSGKWYAVLLRVEPQRVGLIGTEPLDLLNVKCGPMLSGIAREKPGFLPAYHMNKLHWVSLRLDGTASEGDIREFLSISHELTAPKAKKPRKEASE